MQHPPVPEAARTLQRQICNQSMSSFPVFVINLKRDTERLAFMQKQLDKINIPFEALPAVEDDAIPGEQPVPGRPTLGQLGCFQSHIKAWRTMLQRDLPAALILEDDVLLDDDFPIILRSLRLPEECQALQLVAGHKLDTVRNRVFSPYGAISLPNGWKMACHLGDSYGTLAYIIRQDLARRLLQEEGRLRTPVDFILFSWRYSFHLPWMVYKKERRGVYVTLGEEKRDLGSRSIGNARKRHSIEKYIKIIPTGAQRAAVDPAQGKNLPALVINLKKDARRLEAARRRFEAIDLSFETVEAVDGSRIPAETLHKIYDRKRARKNLGRELSPAEIGRYLSHIKAWRAFLKTDAPAAAIVEDHAVPGEHFPRFIRYSGNRKKSSGAWVKRGVFRWKHVFSSPPLPVPLPHDYRPPADEEIARLQPRDVVRRFKASAYMIDRSRARLLLLCKGRRIQRPIDDLLFCAKQRPKELFLEWVKKIFWDAMALFNMHVLCRIFPPTRANKLSMLESGDPPRAGVGRKFKIMLSCYSFSRPFGLDLNRRKTGEPAHE